VRGRGEVALYGRGLYDTLGTGQREITSSRLGWRRQSCWGSSPCWVTPTGPAHPYKRAGSTFWATDVNNIQPANKGADPAARNHAEPRSD